MAFIAVGAGYLGLHLAVATEASGAPRALPLRWDTGDRAAKTIELTQEEYGKVTFTWLGTDLVKPKTFYRHDVAGAFVALWGDKGSLRKEGKIEYQRLVVRLPDDTSIKELAVILAGIAAAQRNVDRSHDKVEAFLGKAAKAREP